MHIIDLHLDPALHGRSDLTNTQQDELLRTARSFIQERWDQGWRGAGVLGTYRFSERTVKVICMAVQHVPGGEDEGTFQVELLP